MSVRKQIFVVVSTNQNLANIPPVLECCHPGDEVVWLESKQAHEGRWSEGTEKVFEKFGLIKRQSVLVDDINDPGQIFLALKPVIDSIPGSDDLFLVANGGPKFTPLGLISATTGRSAQLLYGESRTVNYTLMDSSLQKRSLTSAYCKHKLDLVDILLSSNQGLFEHASPCTWVTPPVLSAYGNEDLSTTLIHDEYHEFFQKNNPDSEPRFDDIEFFVKDNAFFSDAYTTWLRSLSQIVQIGLVASRTLHKRGLDLDKIVNLLKEKKSTVKTVYNSTLRLLEKQKIVCAFRDVPQPSVHLGYVFENAVLERVLKLLHDNNHIASIVQSVWTNVKICDLAKSHIVKAEWDVVLVLKNGVLLTIECKSFDAQQKDLDARRLNLLQAGSQSELLLCGPVYTNFVDKPWFATMHRLKQTVGPKKFIPFTLPEQPSQYNFEDDGKICAYECPSFESSLLRILNGYMPKV